MNEEKLKRIMVSVTITAVTFIVLLFAVVIYQIVIICIYDARNDKIAQEIEKTVEELETSQDWLDQYNLNQEKIMYILALQNGYKPNN